MQEIERMQEPGCVDWCGKKERHDRWYAVPSRPWGESASRARRLKRHETDEDPDRAFDAPESD